MTHRPSEEDIAKKWLPITSTYPWCDSDHKHHICATVLNASFGAILAYKPPDTVSDEIVIDLIMKTLEKTFQVFKNVYAFRFPADIVNGKAYSVETYRMVDFDETYDEKEPQEFVESASSGIIDMFLKNKPVGCDTIGVYTIIPGSYHTSLRMKYIQ